MIEIRVQKDFCLKPFRLRFIDIQLRVRLVNFRLTPVEVVHRMPDRFQDMLFPRWLRKSVPRNGILQPSKLCIRVMAKRSRGASGQKQLPVIQQLLPDRRLYDILIFIQSQDLDRIGVAVQKQADQLIESIDYSVCLPVLILVKCRKSDQIRREIQRNSTEIDIASLAVRAIAIAAAHAEQHDTGTKTGIGPDEAILACIKQRFKIHHNITFLFSFITPLKSLVIMLVV